VSDNGSIDESVKLVRENFPTVRVIENGRNLGFSEGNNVAIRQARGEIVVLLNNDTKVNKDWLRYIAKAAEDERVGIIGCKVCYMGTNIIQDAGSFLNSWGLSFTPDAGCIDDENQSSVVEVDWVTGAALAIKKKVLKKIGLLDPRFSPSFYEDMDICIRAKKNGFIVVTTRGAKIFHYASRTWDKKIIKKAYYMTRNRVYFTLKHYRGLPLFLGLTWYYFYEFSHDMRKFVLQKISAPILNKQSFSEIQKTLSILILEALVSHLFSPIVLLRIALMDFTKYFNTSTRKEQL
jgi:hypothetical protein